MTSPIWKCPHCGALRLKSSKLESYSGFRSFGVEVPAKCLKCGGELELTKLIHGDYDHTISAKPRFSPWVQRPAEALLLGAPFAAAAVCFMLLGGREHVLRSILGGLVALGGGFISADMFMKANLLILSEPLPEGSPPERDVEMIEGQPPPEAPLAGVEKNLVRRLIEMGRPNLGAQGKSLYLTRARDEAREIGKQLHDRGGHELMLRAHAQVVHALSETAGRELEAAWDGIGDWRG